jgi:cyclophilin family peptidyl-prolyl cis-trans isomerase
VKIEVVQAGATRAASRTPGRRSRSSGRTDGIRHRDGTLSMARDGADTATSDFFICIGDQPALDFGGARNPDGQGFGAFGRVVRGMDVVRRIQAAPADHQALTPPSSSAPRTGNAERRVSRADLADGFRALGVRPGDVVFLHASVRAVGPVAGGPDQIHLALKDALTTTARSSCTRAVPTATTTSAAAC